MATGSKTVEIWVAYPDRRTIGPGQLIRFESGGDHLLTRVVRATPYRSFGDLLNHESVTAIGGPGRTRSDLLAILRDLYDRSKESRYGVMALEVERVTGPA
jgi:ASC-1-like (ASCH) protein